MVVSALLASLRMFSKASTSLVALLPVVRRKLMWLAASWARLQCVV
jgi:hypothetical protein